MKKEYIVELIISIVKCDKPTAEMLVERLNDEGLLVLGYGDIDIDQVVARFTDAFGATKTSRYDRFAAGRLTRKYGSQAVCGIIDLLAQNKQAKYVPVVNNLSELEKKFVSVMHFLRNNKGEEMIDV